MKKIQVIVKDQNTLELKEDGLQGDYIDLTSLQELDYNSINKLIEEGKDKVYAQRLADNNKIAEAEYEKKLANVMQKVNETATALTIQLEYKEKEKENALKQKEMEIQLQFSEQIAELNKKIATFENDKKIEILAATTKKEKELFQLERDYKQIEDNLKKKYEEIIKEKDNEIQKLNWQKSLKNVKQTGEDLESWCDGEIKAYMQNGLFNCTWHKDNDVVKIPGDLKGSKADFIFKIYQDDSHQESNLLASVCLEMKDENPDSINKKKNEDYYKQLDNNRKKKDCKYALLVSNLELDKPNILPIYKVNEYADMYVVRPAYMMTFLNMLVSLTNKFKDLLINVEKEQMELHDTIKLTEEFERLKASYLDKPLELLQKEIEKIQASSEDIKKAVTKIDDACNKIIAKYINDIKNKLDKFNIKKLSKELDKRQ